jgi:hypothetical protein
MSTAEILDTTDDTDDGAELDLGELFAALDEMDRRESTDPEVQRARLQALGAPAHLAFDLSDAAHDCISNDDGICIDCANGGTPMLPRNHAKYL